MGEWSKSGGPDGVAWAVPNRDALMAHAAWEVSARRRSPGKGAASLRADTPTFDLATIIRNRSHRPYQAARYNRLPSRVGIRRAWDQASRKTGSTSIGKLTELAMKHFSWAV